MRYSEKYVKELEDTIESLRRCLEDKEERIRELEYEFMELEEMYDT